jgi:hypothetical protein
MGNDDQTPEPSKMEFSVAQSFGPETRGDVRLANQEAGFPSGPPTPPAFPSRTSPRLYGRVIQ